MEKISIVFDYMRISFWLNKKSKKLYQPQIALILLKTFFFVVYGIMLLRLAITIESPSNLKMELMQFGFDTLGWLITMLVVSGIGGLIVESGLYNMYSGCVLYTEVKNDSFIEGVRKYFIRFLSVNLLMLLIAVVLFIPFVIVGLITLMAGFVIIPLLVSIFTAMWKVTIVMEDERVFRSLKDSVNFAKEHFVPLSFLVILKNAFSGIASGGSSFNSSYNSGGNNGKLSDLGINNSDGYKNAFIDWYGQALPYIKTGFYILIPVFSIAMIVGSIVKMIFDVFFSLTLFVMYIESRTENAVVLAKEVL